jgi:predicted metallo-beta-lactamase superfamily hydrolase
MNGSTAEESIKNIDKIISNVAKEVIIDKTNL